jgi:type I restriction enzyme M protein
VCGVAGRGCQAGIKPAIFDHPQFATFTATVAARFAAWKTGNRPGLAGIAVGDKPKALIGTLSESLLVAFRAAPSLDAYDVYQHLMDYWAATMQDDAYLLAQEGWVAVLEGAPNTDLIPPARPVGKAPAVFPAFHRCRTPGLMAITPR